MIGASSETPGVYDDPARSLAAAIASHDYATVLLGGKYRWESRGLRASALDRLALK